MSEARKIDTKDIKTEWHKPDADPLEGLTQQDIQKILEYRSELLMEISKHYIAFTEAIYKLPIHVVYRQHAFFNLDQAEMWVKKGIDNVWDVPVPVEAKAEGAEQEPSAIVSA